MKIMLDNTDTERDDDGFAFYDRRHVFCSAAKYYSKGHFHVKQPVCSIQYSVHIPIVNVNKIHE